MCVSVRWGFSIEEGSDLLDSQSVPTEYRHDMKRGGMKKSQKTYCNIHVCTFNVASSKM